MAVSSYRTNIPAKETFIGAYAVESHAYMETLESAAFPPIYGQLMLKFRIYHDYRTKPAYRIGAAATITIGRYGPYHQGLGYAFYAMVREIIVNSRIGSRVCTHVIVEVHVVPGYIMNWVMIGAQLWAEPPTHIRYVQPHAFLQPHYRTVECDYSEATVIDVSLDSMTTMQWAADCVEHSSTYHISEPSKLHPPALSFNSFPQYPS
jgi:hypothetical protein